MKPGFADEVGIGACGAFFRDAQFWLALVAGIVVWGVAWFAAPGFFTRLQPGSMSLLVSLVVWQPLLEELLFRGVIQGQASRHAWGRWQVLGMSGANMFASLLFALSHLLHHAPVWAAAVLLPSLVFGHFRDRYGSVWPGLALHVFYNAGYFLIGMAR